ncbi:hypothetical protein BATI_2799 [Bacillus anthracis str. Tsiankovskii-I]|nr:hypothetical protein BAMEG_1705 [Bacillus anthracis str. CDC 684]EDV17335.1 hypothetical protein BATI_2799 [Bacillus anthracis str. Tsiankovskii-I]
MRKVRRSITFLLFLFLIYVSLEAYFITSQIKFLTNQKN